MARKMGGLEPHAAAVAATDRVVNNRMLVRKCLEQRAADSVAPISTRIMLVIHCVRLPLAMAMAMELSVIATVMTTTMTTKTQRMKKKTKRKQKMELKDHHQRIYTAD